MKNEIEEYIKSVNPEIKGNDIVKLTNNIIEILNDEQDDGELLANEDAIKILKKDKYIFDLIKNYNINTTKQPKEKISISDAQLKNELIKLFESGNTGKYGKSATFGIIGQKYLLARNRFKETFDKTLKEWQQAKENATNEQMQANQKESLKSGIKTKLERLIELQKQVEQLQKELHDNRTIISTFYDGAMITDYRELTPLERAKIHQVIKEVRAEISKIEGDYAPTKTANTDKDGNDVSDPLATLIKSGGGIKIITKH